jgi:septal ring factor EnvC (AmiA/AmiB activator)
MEAFRVDLADADSLEEQIQRERQQLTFVAQDLIERESVMELSKQLQLDLLSKRKADRALQLERYRELKRAEAEVEKLLSGFKARIELEKVIEEERKEDRKLATSFFGRMKGKLSLPVAGPVVGEYGKAFDSASGLFVFKKGIDISAGPARVVTAVASGKVAFSGAMPGLGQVVIIDQGDNYYTLLGRLSASKVKTDDSVTEGTEIGLSSESGDPVYFEIRSRNIPVNPLLWVSR